MHYIFSSLLVIRMTLLIPFNWLSWFKFIYFQLIIISGRIQWNCLFCQGKKIQLLITFFYFFMLESIWIFPLALLHCFPEQTAKTLPLSFTSLNTSVSFFLCALYQNYRTNQFNLWCLTVYFTGWSLFYVIFIYVNLSNKIFRKY